MTARKQKIKGSVILYVNIGNLPTDKCEELILKYKNQLEEWITDCRSAGYPVVIIPQRDSETRVEQIVFNYVPEL